MTKIKFNEADHSYKNGKTKYTPVSTIIGKYKNPYDSEYWSTYKAYERLINNEKDFKWLKREAGYPRKDYGLFKFLDMYVDRSKIPAIKKEILKEWKLKNTTGVNKGNMYHEYMENKAINDGFVISNFNNKKYPTITSVKIDRDNKGEVRTPGYKSLKDLADGFHPELILWNDLVMVAGQADMVFIETIDGVRYVDIDDHKGLDLNTKIPTPTGWILMRDIKVGDSIFDGKGNITKVKNVSEIHYNPCYKIKFDNNSEVICDHEHRWVISNLKKQQVNTITNYNRINSVMTTEELFSYYNNNTTKLGIEINPIQLEEVELELDPYILGLWLADGNKTCGTITCVNSSIWNEVHRRGYSTSVDHNRNNNKAESRTIFGISNVLSKLNLIGNKHIPDLYLRSSYTQRLDLLRGYMDGDGYYNKSRNRFVMQTTNIRQAEDIQTLVCSLGYKATIIKYKGSRFGKTNIQCYSVSFRMNENPFLCRNQDININYNFKNNFNYIKSIEKVDTIPTKCLAVESNEKTYLFGNSLITTHNTNGEIKTTNIWDKMLDPLQHLDDCNYIHYCLQISIYAWMLEQEGYVVRDLRFTHINKPYPVSYMKYEIENMFFPNGEHYMNLL